MITNGFSSSQLSFTVNCTETGCHVGQLVNVSYPEVFSCLLVYSISNPIHFLLFHVIFASWMKPGLWVWFPNGAIFTSVFCGHRQNVTCLPWPATPQRRVFRLTVNPQYRLSMHPHYIAWRHFECLSFLPEDQVYKPLLIKLRDCYM